MEAELPHADGQSDMTKLVVDFRNFANEPKNCVRQPYAVVTKPLRFLRCC